MSVHTKLSVVKSALTSPSALLSVLTLPSNSKLLLSNQLLAREQAVVPKYLFTGKFTYLYHHQHQHDHIKTNAAQVSVAINHDDVFNSFLQPIGWWQLQ
jgi:hypothetical protein